MKSKIIFSLIYFFETQLPDMDSFLLAKKIKEHQSDCLFLFVSNRTDAVFDAFQLPAFRFLPKAHLQERLEEAFLSAISQIKTIHSQYYVIQSGTALERVPLHRIIYIVREGNYCVFQDETGTQYRIRSSLKSVYKNLPADKFIYINQIICSVSHIEKIEGDTVFCQMDHESMLQRFCTKNQEYSASLLDRCKSFDICFFICKTVLSVVQKQF